MGSAGKWDLQKHCQILINILVLTEIRQIIPFRK